MVQTVLGDERWRKPSILKLEDGVSTFQRRTLRLEAVDGSGCGHASPAPAGLPRRHCYAVVKTAQGKWTGARRASGVRHCVKSRLTPAFWVLPLSFCWVPHGGASPRSGMAPGVSALLQNRTVVSLLPTNMYIIYIYANFLLLYVFLEGY